MLANVIERSRTCSLNSSCSSARRVYPNTCSLHTCGSIGDPPAHQGTIPRPNCEHRRPADGLHASSTSRLAPSPIPTPAVAIDTRDGSMTTAQVGLNAELQPQPARHLQMVYRRHECGACRAGHFAVVRARVSARRDNPLLETGVQFASCRRRSFLSECLDQGLPAHRRKSPLRIG